MEKFNALKLGLFRDQRSLRINDKKMIPASLSYRIVLLWFYTWLLSDSTVTEDFVSIFLSDGTNVSDITRMIGSSSIQDRQRCDKLQTDTHLEYYFLSEVLF
jgi:hypothetical protein